MSRESLSPSSAAPLPVSSGILCPISVVRCYVGITPAAGHPPASAQKSQPEMAPCCRPSPGDKSCLRTGAKVPGAAGMPGCGRREPPAVTHGPARLPDGHPQPHGGARSHREQRCEGGVGRIHPPAKQDTSQSPPVPAETSVQGRCCSLGYIRAGSKQNHHYSPWHMNPRTSAPPAFQHLSAPSQLVQQREVPSASAAAGERPCIHPSIHASICPFVQGMG